MSKTVFGPDSQDATWWTAVWAIRMAIHLLEENIEHGYDAIANNLGVVLTFAILDLADRTENLSSKLRTLGYRGILRNKRVPDGIFAGEDGDGFSTSFLDIDPPTRAEWELLKEEASKRFDE